MADLRVQNEGNIFLLYQETDLGRQWVEDNLPEDAMTWGGAVVVEHRYIGAIVAGAQGDGLEVE